jgi:hypothetical protein
MTTSSEHATTLLERYQIHFGVGLLLVIVLGLMLMQGDGADGQDALQSSAQEAAVPPMPATEVVVVEDEVIDQVEVNYDASLDLTTAVASGR